METSDRPSCGVEDGLETVKLCLLRALLFRNLSKKGVHKVKDPKNNALFWKTPLPEPSYKVQRCPYRVQHRQQTARNNNTITPDKLCKPPSKNNERSHHKWWHECFQCISLRTINTPFGCSGSRYVLVVSSNGLTTKRGHNFKLYSRSWCLFSVNMYATIGHSRLNVKVNSVLFFLQILMAQLDAASLLNTFGCQCRQVAA